MIAVLHQQVLTVATIATVKSGQQFTLEGTTESIVWTAGIDAHEHNGWVNLSMTSGEITRPGCFRSNRLVAIVS